MNNSKITIEPMVLPRDKEEISSWQTRFGKDKDFETIQHFILEDDTFISLGEVVEVNFEIHPIGNDERQFSYVAREKNNKIIAWILLDYFDISSDNPELFIQYIMIHPKYQGMHYGSQILKEILSNPTKYIGGNPKNFFTYIDIKNIHSQTLFAKFGFSFENTSSGFLRASTEQPNLESSSSPPNFGE